jgi:hypothetical protein
MCYGGGLPSLTVGRLLDAAGWPRPPAMPCHNGWPRPPAVPCHNANFFFKKEEERKNEKKLRAKKGEFACWKMKSKNKQSLLQRRKGTVPVLSALGDWSWSLLTHAHIHCCPASLDCLVARVSIVLPEPEKLRPQLLSVPDLRRYGDR